MDVFMLRAPSLLSQPSILSVRRSFVLILMMFSLVCGFVTQANLRFSSFPRTLGRSRAFTQFVSASSSDPSATTFNPSYSLYLSIPTSEDMEEVGALISVMSNPPDILFLDGDLGAGKTTFARGFVQCKLGLEEADDHSIRVTSPTYLLSNTYAYKSTGSNGYSVDEIHHMDLYRLSGTSPKDFDPLHLDQVFTKYISLIEWPSRLFPYPELMPPPTNRLDIDLSIVPSTDERRITLTTPVGSTWKDRLEHLVEEGMLDDLLLDDNVGIDDDLNETTRTT